MRYVLFVGWPAIVFWFYCILSGVSIGAWCMVWWLHRRRSGIFRKFYAYLSALRAHEGMGTAAWEAKERMHREAESFAVREEGLI